MLRRSILVLLSMLIASAPALADTAFQDTPERSPYLSFSYPSGSPRLPANNVIWAYSRSLADTTGHGIPASGTVTFGGRGWWYWEDVAPAMYFFAKVNGSPDSVFLAPDYYRMGFKTAPPGSVGDDAFTGSVSAGADTISIMAPSEHHSRMQVGADSIRTFGPLVARAGMFFINARGQRGVVSRFEGDWTINFASGRKRYAEYVPGLTSDYRGQISQIVTADNYEPIVLSNITYHAVQCKNDSLIIYIGAGSTVNNNIVHWTATLPPQ